MFFCNCLNVGIEIKSRQNETKTKTKVNAVPGINDYELLEFIKSVNCLVFFLPIVCAKINCKTTRSIVQQQFLRHTRIYTISFFT